jgi:ABC-type amino acid transport substrate-binding protein
MPTPTNDEEMIPATCTSGAIRRCIGVAVLIGIFANASFANDLPDIRQRGVLRHLGVPYAHFVRHSAKGLDGLDVELMQQFARHLGVSYEWVETSWSTAFGDLTGREVRPAADGGINVVGQTTIRGDVIANGLTILPWRTEVVDYSTPTFPTGVWLIARADSPIKPIAPSGDIQTDIQRVKDLLQGRSVLTMTGTCLDAQLYDLAATGAQIRYHTQSESLNDIAPAILDGAAEATLLDIPDALVALQQWPGEIKIIGPISEPQLMGVAVAPTSPMLLEAFNRFFHELNASGAYDALVRKYYPSVFLYLGDFFKTEAER